MTMSSLHLTIKLWLDQLKQQCHELCDGDKSSQSSVQPLNEFFSSVQLWKERSLHHTLETLDKAGVPSADNRIEAMENHEKAAKVLFELTRKLLNRTWNNMNLYLDAFGQDLVGIVDNIVTLRLEEQQIVHDKVVKSMKDENQKLSRNYQDSQKVNADLEKRLEVLENTSGAGGDAILCNKLRSRVQHLVIRQHELSIELQNGAQERLKHRRELEKTKTLLADSQKSLAVTRAMHDKETRQLAALVQLNRGQVAQILDTTANGTDQSRHQQPVERFDPVSGCMIVHLTPVSTPQKPPGSPSTYSTSSRRSSSPVIATSPIQKKQGEPPTNTRQRLERPKSAISRSSRRTTAPATRRCFGTTQK